MKGLAAIFIGGHFDMTKQMLSHKMDRVEFAEPPKDLKFMPLESIKEQPILCNILIYRLVAETPEGVLVYEINRG